MYSLNPLLEAHAVSYIKKVIGKRSPKLLKDVESGRVSPRDAIRRLSSKQKLEKQLKNDSDYKRIFRSLI